MAIEPGISAYKENRKSAPQDTSSQILAPLVRYLSENKLMEQKLLAQVAGNAPESAVVYRREF